jgi:hypothetical protein
MPFAAFLRRATARDERGPFRAPSPLFRVVDRSCLRRTETSSGNAEAARELHPTFPVRYFRGPWVCPRHLRTVASLEAGPSVVPDYVSVIYTRESEHEPSILTFLARPP